MQDITDVMSSEAGQAEQSALLDLWTIDLTSLGGDICYLHNGVNEKGEPVIWQGQEYQPYPIQGDGFELNGKGPSNQPTLTVSNLFGLVTGIASSFHDCAGGRVVRRRVYVRFLDAVNFYAGNPEANPEQELYSRFDIEQLVSLTASRAIFRLAVPGETDGYQFPGRVMLADICNWIYRSAECGYNGPPVADQQDNPVSDPAKDACGKRRCSCCLRKNEDNFGGFLSIGKLG
ncbi:phage minor tail protein L [Salmonella enterica subsp. enterica]|nr:phage minor tail protein L [Salmonella enterica subsp. enterica]